MRRIIVITLISVLILGGVVGVVIAAENAGKQNRTNNYIDTKANDNSDVKPEENEVRKKYEEDVIERLRQRFKGLSDEEYAKKAEEQEKRLADTLGTIIVKDEFTKLSNIPTSTFDQIVNVEDGFWIGADYSVDGHHSAARNQLNSLIMQKMGMPSPAVRERSDCSRYMVFDLDDDCRLFVFLRLDDQKDGILRMDGFPVYYKNKRSYADFSALSVGDTFSDVVNVDDMCNHYDRMLQLGVANNLLELRAELGIGVCSIHYLTDGLLKIEYGAVNENKEPVITAISYYPDYIMENCLGEKINYRLNPLDIPE